MDIYDVRISSHREWRRLRRLMETSDPIPCNQIHKDLPADRCGIILSLHGNKRMEATVRVIEPHVWQRVEVCI